MTTVNITVHNDHDFYRVFRYETISGVPINITGAQLTMMVRRDAADEAAVLKLTTLTGEIVLTNAAQGTFTVRITQDQLEQLGTGDFDHSMVMTLGGLKSSIWNGVLTNDPGPSR
jgi:hypothetical protein